MKKQAPRSKSQSSSNFKHKSVKPNKKRSTSLGKPNKSKPKFTKQNKNSHNNNE
jgi:hypothetical protein